MSHRVAEEPWALFHFNRKTNERVRCNRSQYPPMSRSAAEAEALASRRAQAITDWRSSDWETRAFPDEDA